MTFYDALALHYLHHPLPYRRIALASFTGYAFSNNLGLSLVAGSSVRYRLYSSWGFSVTEIAKVIAFCSVTLWLGFLLLAGIVFIFEPLKIPEALHVPFTSVKPLGIFFLALVASYLVLSLIHTRPFKIKGSSPSPRPASFSARWRWPFWTGFWREVSFSFFSLPLLN